MTDIAKQIRLTSRDEQNNKVYVFPIIRTIDVMHGRALTLKSFLDVMEQRMDSIIQTTVSYDINTPKQAGVAATGVSTSVSRGDHVHPEQEHITGNAATSTKWKTPIHVGFSGGLVTKSVIDLDGSKDITFETELIEASALIRGGVKIDGVSIKINNQGQIYAVMPINLIDDSMVSNSKTYSSTKILSLISNSGFITNAVETLINYYNKTEINTLLSNLSSINMKVVLTLPATNISSNTIYLRPKSSGSSENIYDEFVYINNSWENIGSTSVDLSNYLTKSQLLTTTGTSTNNTMTQKAISEAIGNTLKRVVGTTQNPIIITSLSTGYYIIEGYCKIYNSDVTPFKVTNDGITYLTNPYFEGGLDITLYYPGVKTMTFTLTSSTTWILTETVESISGGGVYVGDEEPDATNDSLLWIKKPETENSETHDIIASFVIDNVNLLDKRTFSSNKIMAVINDTVVDTIDDIKSNTIIVREQTDTCLHMKVINNKTIQLLFGTDVISQFDLPEKPYQDVIDNYTMNVQLTPNVTQFIDASLLCTSLTITLGAGTKVSEYHAFINLGATLPTTISLLDGTKWLNNVIPTLKANTIAEINVQNGIAVYGFVNK